MSVSLFINSIGLFLDISGALLMYFNSQAVNYQIYFHDHEHLQKLKIKANKMNRRIRQGAILLVCGFILQLIASFIKF